jgi:hypothetical protein
MRADNGVRPDFDIGGEVGLRRDDGGGMNRRHA